MATGTVTFTNKGSKPLDIPSGTVLSTNSATPVQFVTVADVYVQPDARVILFLLLLRYRHNFQVKAAMLRLTVLLLSHLIVLPRSHKTIQGLHQLLTNLTVTNTDPTTGGGATNVKAVTSSDANALAATLQQQIQNEVNAWLKTVVHPGDVAGTPVPNVLTSATLLPEETFITTPAVGQPAPGGKFTGVLTAKVSVLVIRNASIQVAGRAQLMAHALHMNPPAVVATSLPVTVKVTKSTPSQDGKSLTVIVDATGHVVQQVSAQQISQQLARKECGSGEKFYQQSAGWHYRSCILPILWSSRPSLVLCLSVQNKFTL